MRLLLIMCFIAATNVCFAKNVVTQDSVQTEDKKLENVKKPIIPSGRTVLVDMKTHNPDMFSQYQSARKKQRTGIILTGIGGGLFLAGAIVSVLPEDANGKINMWPYVYETDAEKRALRTVGVVYMVGGATCLSVGLPLLIAGGKNKKQIFRDFMDQYYFSQQPSSYFKMNIYPNRVGVAYVF